MKNFELTKEIKELLDEIDISEANYEKATNRYNSIANYINSSNLEKYSPDIYLQGSIKLGTAIKPLASDGSYDIDIICNLTKKRRENQTQKHLKEEVGEVIKKYTLENGMKNKPNESKRCWTLNYVDESNFHIDILPSVPWNEYDDGNIAITDLRNRNFQELSLDWEISNPKGYSEWFKSQSNFQKIKADYEKRFYASVEKIPDYKIKTPLQRIVQLLKRHAEVMFEKNMEYKPSSVIITTLAGIAYPYCENISNSFEELFLNVIKSLVDGIEYENEKPCIYNPIRREEKLSLKWDKSDEYFKEFMLWIEQLSSDFVVTDYDLPLNDRLFYIKRSMRREKNEIGISLDNLYYHKKPIWEFSRVYNIPVNIKTFYSWKSITSKEIKSGEAINKNGKLRFEISSENIRDYDIYWQITNTGIEANTDNCLRGDFYNSEILKGKKIRTEETKYIGRHYVEAFLVKDDICYGKSRPFEVNIIKDLALKWTRH